MVSSDGSSCTLSWKPTIEPSRLGKTKMVLQVFAITVLVLEPRFGALRLYAPILLWLVVVFALVSAAGYFWDFWKPLGGRAKRTDARRLVVLPTGGKEEEERDVAAH